MFDTAYMVDEILFLLAMDWAYEVLVQVLCYYGPMLSIVIIAICYWDLLLGDLHNKHVSK
jgi:hypothetical protein